MTPSQNNSDFKILSTFFIGCSSGVDLLGYSVYLPVTYPPINPLGEFHLPIFGIARLKAIYSLWLYLLLFCCCRKPWWNAALGRECLFGLQFQGTHSIMGTGALAAGVWGWSLCASSGVRVPTPTDWLPARLHLQNTTPSPDSVRRLGPSGQTRGPMGPLRFNCKTRLSLHSIKLGVATRCQHTLSSVRSVYFAYCPFCDCVLLAVFVSFLAHTQMHGF